MTVLSQGRFSAPYRAAYDVVVAERCFRLRHYTPAVEALDGAPRASLLLVPPLMVTSEVYDISPELSAVGWLREQGVDVWLCDFGDPTRVEGGLERTLDDHVLAVDRCIDEVARRTGQPVHLAGYSQGGMFCYQAAAYRQSRDLASVLTFGSPVDVRKVIPVPLHGDVATRLLASARDAVARPLEEIRGLPGAITSTGFKLLSARKEVQQMVEFFGLLPDTEALARREPRRRFLGGEGFVAWPAPALRRFIDEVVVKNLMANGGLVINRRPVTLTDITCPILCFVGLKDEIARPASVRSIRKAAPMAEIHEIPVVAGHFGLVVGSRALGQTWPAVLEWMQWREGLLDGSRFEADDELPEDEELLEREPSLTGEFAAVAAGELEDDEGYEGDTLVEGDGEIDDGELIDREAAMAELGIRGIYDAATDALDSLWHRVGDVTLDISNVIESMRWQIPRLARLKRLRDSSRVSPGRALEEQARAIPDSDFFLFGDRAWTYREANERVNQFVHAFRRAGIQPGQQVGVLLDNHPDYLTVVVALSRMGSVAVLFNSGLAGLSLSQALGAVGTSALIVDTRHTDAADWYEGAVVRIGSEPGPARDGVTDLRDLLRDDEVEPPDDIPVNAGRGRDTAFLMFTSGTTGLPKAARITNRRWAMAALGAAAGAQLTNRDTVYCCLPLYHATGLLIGCGGALVGGSRLAVAPKFSATTFWHDVHRYGATVVTYVGELCRYLVNNEPSPMERDHSLRLLVGNGMRADVWEQVLERFGRVRVIEFYGSTEGNVVLANLSGEKVGSVGRELLDDSEIALVRYDLAADDFVRDGEGRLQRCADDEPGVLFARIDDIHPVTRFDGYLSKKDSEHKVFEDVFEPGDAWFNTGDMLRRDSDGDYWFIDRLGDTFRWKGENVSTEQVSAALLQAPEVGVCSVYGVRLPGREGRAGMAAIQLVEGQTFDARGLARIVERNLFPAARPLFLRVVEQMPITSTLKLVKHRLQQEGADPNTVPDPLYWYDESGHTYRPLTPVTWKRLLETL